MAPTPADCQLMIDAGRKAGRKLMVAYRCRYEPYNQEAIRMARSGELGPTQVIVADAGWRVTDPDQWRLRKALASGGSLMDLGIYPLNAIRQITGEEPVDFTAIVAARDTSGLYAEVEESMEWTMKFPSGIIASCGCSYGQIGPSFLHINGDEGNLELEPAFFYDGVHLRGQAGDQVIEQLSTGKSPYQFTLEAEHFSDCIRNDKEPESPGEEGLKDMLAIEAIYKAAGAPIA